MGRTSYPRRERRRCCVAFQAYLPRPVRSQLVELSFHHQHRRNGRIHRGAGRDQPLQASKATLNGTNLVDRYQIYSVVNRPSLECSIVYLNRSPEFCIQRYRHCEGKNVSTDARNGQRLPAHYGQLVHGTCVRVGSRRMHGEQITASRKLLMPRGLQWTTFDLSRDQICLTTVREKLVLFYGI